MKRKRLEMLETSPSGAESRPKRRRNDTTLLDTIQYIFDCLRNHWKEDEDVYLCEAFLRVPRKKTEPQYFDVVKRPIDMLKIQQKIKTDQYDELQDFCDDVQLLVDNAKLYYAKSTEEYKDACQLWILYEESRLKAPDEVKEKQKQKQQQMEEDEKFTSKKRGNSRIGRGASAPLILMEDGLGMTQREAIQELFGAIITARDGDDRLLSYVFRILPSKERYPEYYTVIDKPIDLRTMATRICDDEYDDLESIAQDFDLMFSNACQFNEPGSCIFRDACKLKKFVHLRKQDLQDVIAAGRGRLRCRKPAEGGEWHVLLSGLEEGAALPLAEEEISASDEAATLGTAADDDDNDDDADPENPLWKLFLLAKNLTVPSNQNYHLIEPFRRLPNRRWHADYYNEIIHPISMSQIRNKIKKGEYSSITDLHADFNLMLNNAQHYNRPDSRIHRDAITLQAAVNAAVVQITGEGKASGRAAAAATATIHAAGQTGWADSDTDGEDSRQSMSSSNKRRAGQAGSELSFKRRARLLFKTLMDYMTEDGRQPIVAFIEKPSRREYPDYYQVIEKPIDMETIETRIKSDFYGSEKELLADFRLMFNNCITYNEEGSVIHSDAQTLDKVLTDKVSELNQGGSSSCGLEATGAGDVSYDTPGSSSLSLPTPILSNHGSPASATPAAHTPGVAQPSKVLHLKKAKQQPPLGTLRNVKNVYNAVREYRDVDGRQISDVFLKLPPKILYPDYYDLIKHPIDLERVLYKWKTGTYSSVDDCLADLTLLFNNACRYNEPDSQIYRDALTLQQIALQKRLELVWQDAKVPRVRALVQELLMSLFITVFNHEDKGRYTAESFADIPTQDPAPRSEHQTGSLTIKNRPLTFDILKRRLDKGLYSRLDHFQEDIFSIFVRARRLSSTSSRVYRDSVTLQTAYIAARDKVCGSGRILKSHALKFSLADLEAELKEDAEAHVDEGEVMETGEDVPAEQNDDKNEKNSSSVISGGISIQHNKINYSVGDFVYVVPAEPSLAKRIIHIQRLFRSNSSKTKGGSNVQMIQGFHYFRPEDTFHPANRKFYAKEVFKTEKHLTFPVTDVVGKCLVLFIMDYPKLHVENIPADDVFVCESRYMARHRFFKKIKVVPFSIPESAMVSERETPLTMTKVDSVFKERLDRHREELAEVDEETRVQRVPLPNVARSSTNSEAGEMEFEQYNLGSGAVVKLGDFVYVKVPPIVVPGSSSNTATLKAIRHVTRIWLSPQGVCSFLGSVYSTAQELYMSGVQLERLVAYKQEVYLTSVQDSLPLTDIIGRCSVLHVKEYAACRLTEVLEKDVYLCQNFYDETTRRISPLQSGIAKFTLSRQVLQDEVYYFSNTVNLQKAVLETVNLAQLPRRQPAPQPQLGAPGLVPLDDDLSNDLAGEDSLDSSAAPSRSSGSTPPPAPSLLHSAPASPALHTPAGKGSKKGRKQVSGYLLFSSEIRKSVTMRNPSANFGEISRLVGMEWKKLCEVERKAFEDRAHVVNQEAAERALHCSPGELLPGQVAGSLEMPLPNSPDIVYECMWSDCDVMFEDLADLYEHLLNEQTGHVCKMAASCTVSFECQWRSCSRQKKSSLLPFPLLARLVRHTREVHIIKNTGRIVQHHDRTRNFIPSSRRPLINAAAAASVAAGTTPPATTLPGFTPGKAGFQVSVLGGATAAPTTGLAGLLQPQRQPQPIFAATPTKTQRLLHSEAYIKYIENLDKPYQSNWERHLCATADNTPVNDSLRLPTHWLPKDSQVPHPEVKQESKDVKKDALQALWGLRELMMKDALYGVM